MSGPSHPGHFHGYVMFDVGAGQGDASAKHVKQKAHQPAQPKVKVVTISHVKDDSTNTEKLVVYVECDEASRGNAHNAITGWATAVKVGSAIGAQVVFCCISDMTP